MITPWIRTGYFPLKNFDAIDSNFWTCKSNSFHLFTHTHTLDRTIDSNANRILLRINLFWSVGVCPSNIHECWQSIQPAQNHHFATTGVRSRKYAKHLIFIFLSTISYWKRHQIATTPFAAHNFPLSRSFSLSFYLVQRRTIYFGGFVLQHSFLLIYSVDALQDTLLLTITHRIIYPLILICLCNQNLPRIFVRFSEKKKNVFTAFKYTPRIDWADNFPFSFSSFFNILAFRSVSATQENLAFTQFAYHQ